MKILNTKKRSAEQLADDLKQLDFKTPKQAKIYAPQCNSAKQTLFFASRRVNPLELKRKAQEVEETLLKKVKVNQQDTNPSLSLGGENAVFNNFQLKRFADGATPITYKEGNVNGVQRSASIINKIIERRVSQLKPPAYQGVLSKIVEEGHLSKESAYMGLSLIKQADQCWAVYDAISRNMFQPEAGQTYIFVTMPDHTIRIASTANGHALLSNCARYVRYAGEVVFDEQQRIASWNNQSGAYYPAPFLASQAGFGDGLARFEAKYDRNDQAQQSLTSNDVSSSANFNI